MIVVVSLNPSIDRTMNLTDFRVGATNRVQHVRVDAGGKGVNVCLHLSALGAQNVRCVGFMRQSDETMFSEALSDAGIAHRWISLPGHVRTNTKICTPDGELTELNEAGEPVPETAVQEMLQLCRETFAGANVVVLTGSIPPGVPKGIYARLTEIAANCGAACILDADGDALRLGIEACPTLVKPNKSELERLTGRALPDESALSEAADELMARNVAYGCVSLGGEGALFFSDAWKLRIPALNVPVRSTVGAGDAMTAAFALAMEQQMGEKESFCLAVAASAAAVTTEGTQPVDGELVKRLMKYAPDLMEEIGERKSRAHTAALISTNGVKELSEDERAAAIQRQIFHLFDEKR